MFPIQTFLMYFLTMRKWYSFKQRWRKRIMSNLVKEWTDTMFSPAFHEWFSNNNINGRMKLFRFKKNLIANGWNILLGTNSPGMEIVVQCFSSYILSHFIRLLLLLFLFANIIIAGRVKDFLVPPRPAEESLAICFGRTDSFSTSGVWWLWSHWVMHSLLKIFQIFRLVTAATQKHV